MTDAGITNESEYEVRRPLGVWILTIYAALFAGLVPIITSIVVFASSELRTASGMGVGSLIFSIALGTATVVSAVGTWKGNNKARVALLVTVSLYYGLIGLDNALALFSGAVPTSLWLRLFGRVVRGVLYPAVYVWYFRRWELLEFYGI